MSDKTVEELVRESTQKGSFKFLDALRNRSHPTDLVNVYLDEAAAYPLIELDQKITPLRNMIAALGDQESDGEPGQIYLELKAEIAEVEKEIEAVSETLKHSRYVFHVRGVTPGFQEDILTKVRADYPVEYDEYTNEVTGARVKEEIESPERDRLYTNLLWQGHIVKIVDPEGNEEVAPDLETIAALRRELPVAATYELEQAMQKVDMAVDWQKLVVDEGFLAKS